MEPKNSEVFKVVKRIVFAHQKVALFKEVEAGVWSGVVIVDGRNNLSVVCVMIPATENVLQKAAALSAEYVHKVQCHYAQQFTRLGEDEAFSQHGEMVFILHSKYPGVQMALVPVHYLPELGYDLEAVTLDISSPALSDFRGVECATLLEGGAIKVVKPPYIQVDILPPPGPAEQ